MAFIFEKDPVTGYQHPAVAVIPFRAEKPRDTPTFASILAAVDVPLNQFERSEPAPPNAIEKHRLLLQLQPGKFQPGAEWDETTPAGREALMLELGFVPETP